MNLPNTINVMLQGIAEVLIFVAFCLLLCFFAIIGLAMEELISERANLVRA
jgi:hypothetical protein